MFRRFAVPFFLTVLMLALIACTTESAKVTATPGPTASPVNEPLPTVTVPAPQTPTPVPGIQSFEDQLMQAVLFRDFTQLQGLMGDSFMIAGWRSEGTSYAPDAAIEQLQNSYLGKDTPLLIDPNRDLSAVLDGMDPLSILGPDVNEPRALYVSGWGMEGQDDAILYIAHSADGVPYWYGVLIGPGGFAPASSGEDQESAAVLAIPETSMSVVLPPGQMLMKNTELYRRGSFASYDFVLPEELAYPYLAEIQFFSRQSIEDFTRDCAGAEYPCFFGDYPDVARYDGQKAAFLQRQDHEDFSLREFAGRPYFVSQHSCEGAPCIVREYTTFAGDTKVDVWVMMDGAAADGSQAAQADELFSQLSIRDDWAGIGAIPGPLYTLVNPGVTLRYPLGWTVHEEIGSDQDFVVHSISFIPPAFAESEQPQVPAIDLFVYGRPLTDTLQTWLNAYSTKAAFGTDAAPDTHFFGAGHTKVVLSASFSGLRITHDVLGLSARELLFAVGPTVVGLSVVDFGPEDLDPAFLQIQSSLAVANTAPLAQATDTSAILAVKDAAIYRGPDATSQQIGQVMEGQLALVTGVSADGMWWRVICPNDAIGDCWVSADPLATQPTVPPGVYPEPAANSTWTEYRDERYGYGIAVPCHWVLLPPPLEGNFATLTLRSYDDEFLMKNTAKGEWMGGQWPGGAMKMDVTVIEGIAPGQAMADFVSQQLSSNEFTTLEAVNEIQIGPNQAVAVVTARSDNPSEKYTTVAFRMAPEKVLMMSVVPDGAWESSDMQAILNSAALTAEDPVTVPSYGPGAPIIAVPDACAE
jgi:hypothetical protein